MGQGRWVALGLTALLLAAVGCMFACLITFRSLAPKAGAVRSAFLNKAPVPPDADRNVIAPPNIGSFELQDAAPSPLPKGFPEYDLIAVYAEGGVPVTLYYTARHGTGKTAWKDLSRAAKAATKARLIWKVGRIRCIRGAVRNTDEAFWAWEDDGSTFVVLSPDIAKATEFAREYPY